MNGWPRHRNSIRPVAGLVSEQRTEVSIAYLDSSAMAKLMAEEAYTELAAQLRDECVTAAGCDRLPPWDIRQPHSRGALELAGGSLNYQQLRAIATLAADRAATKA